VGGKDLKIDSSKKQVVIIGGGFAGLNCAKALHHQAVEITVIDRKNHHLFQPLLYQVATATLAPSNIAQPIRSILRDYPNIKVLLDDVVGFNLDTQSVKLGSGSSISYDFLVVASGSTHSYFGHDNWEQFAPGLKTIEDAVEIRKQIFLAFEKAESQMHDQGKHEPLVFVVIGAGPTGVELAGAIADTAKVFLKKDFRLCNPSDARILLIEGEGKVLGPYPQSLQLSALEQLKQLGVEVLLSTKVQDVEDHLVITDKGKYEASVIIWAAGVAASPLGKMLGDVDKRGCVKVDAYLNPTVEEKTAHKNVFVLGDLAHFEQEGKQVPGVAQTAIQMGNYAAHAIACDLQGKERPQFKYFDRGEMATIGRLKAVAQIRWPFKADLSGYPAWLGWLVIHILFLIGLKNRIQVLLQWMWTFFSKRWGVGLITFEGDEKQEVP